MIRSPAIAVGALTSLAVLLGAPPAQADGTISNFHVKDGGKRIRHVIDVCTDHPHTVHFVTYLEPDDGWPTYKASFSDRQPAGCFTYTLSRRDIFASGFWWGRVKASVGGQVRTTRWRQFFID